MRRHPSYISGIPHISFSINQRCGCNAESSLFDTLFLCWFDETGIRRAARDFDAIFFLTFSWGVFQCDVLLWHLRSYIVQSFLNLKDCCVSWSRILYWLGWGSRRISSQDVSTVLALRREEWTRTAWGSFRSRHLLQTAQRACSNLFSYKQWDVFLSGQPTILRLFMTFVSQPSSASSKLRSVK